MVVEDEPLIRPAAIDALEDAGFTVLEAASADAAMDIIGEEAIHFLFTDIQTPGVHTGVDLAHAVHLRFPDAGIESVRFEGPNAPSWKRGPRTIPGRGPRDTYG